MTLSPEQFDAAFNQALAAQHAGDLAAAQAGYEALLAENPQNAALLVNLAGVYSSRGDLDTCLTLLAQAIQVAPCEAYAHFAQGNALARLGRYAEARESYRQAIGINATVASFHTQLGSVLQQLGDAEDALAAHDQAVALSPQSADAHNHRGNLLAALRQQKEALAGYEHAHALAPQNAIYLCNRGAMLHHFKRYDEALYCYDQALIFAPNYTEGWINRGTLLGDMQRPDEALASFEHARKLQPQAYEAQWNQSLLQIRLGQYAEGWKNYEARWHKPAFRTKQRHYAQPLWLGDAEIAGKTILLHPEQGFGDTIQFSRYVPWLEKHGAKVILEAQPPLVPLLKTLSGNAQVIATGATLPPFDLHCPIMSLPLACGTTLETIPAEIPYLSADAQKQQSWEEKLGPRMMPRIGLAWSGAAGHVNDHNRSIGLATFQELLTLPYEFHAIQKDIREEDRALLQAVRMHSDDLTDFSDTAALVAAMDLVISVDTSLVHLAGALGKPTWLLLPYIPDARWLMGRADSPWYPTMRLFRQSAAEDWAEVLAEITQALSVEEAPTQEEIDATVEEAFTEGLAAQQAGDLATAESVYRLILEANPNHLNTLANLSSLYLSQGKFEEAVELIGRALALDPNHAALHYNYGKILMHAKMSAEALAAFDAAIKLQPKNATFHSNRGIALYELTRYEDAIASYNRAIAFDGKTAEFYNNRGNALGHVMRFREAMADYARATELAPEMADAQWNRALLQLMHGEFADGWKQYEWRWKKQSFAKDLRERTTPLWLGETPAAGKTILIYPEQGLGDMIQFVRYVPLLEAQGAKVILEAQPSLVALLKTVSLTAEVIARDSVSVPFDLHCPVMSLPLAFGTTVETIPHHVPYLHVDASKRSAWQKRLGPKTKPRVGLVWSGSATHVNDHNRSIPLELLAPLFSQPFEFHSLQKEVRACDLAYLPGLKTHETELKDFTDTAALIEEMDLVISVDTSVAHLAGALGKPLWILLPPIPDYRWLLKCEETPWYPTARLFRQQEQAGWSDTIARVGAALADVS